MVQLTMSNGQILEMDEEELGTLLAETQGEEEEDGPSSSSPGGRKLRKVSLRNHNLFHSSSSKHQQQAQSIPFYRQSWCWAMTLIFLVVVVLFATDSLEVHVTIRGVDQRSHKNKNMTTKAHNPTTEDPITKDNETQGGGDGGGVNQVPTTTNPKPKNPKRKQPKTKQSNPAGNSSGGTTPATFPFLYRGPKLDSNQRQELITKWGQWSLIDDDASTRPNQVCGTFSHCDVPHDKFPPHAWQTDEQFLSKFIPQAQEMLTRAQEAILAEYGQSKFDNGPVDHPNNNNNKTLLERSLNFQLSILRLGEEGSKDRPPPKRQAVPNNGGWTTPRSFQGLVRRLLHAIITQDTFTVVMGGHSAAAGHGNYFKQSYIMQFHKVMEPVFARLGVRLISYNMAQGGLGTIQNAMAMGSLYGDEIDFNMWDSGMTEQSPAHYELYARQALLSGNRVPMLWGGIGDVLEGLHNMAHVDLGGPGSGTLNLLETQSELQASQIPYAVRYMNCPTEMVSECKKQAYNAICWIDRSDVHPMKTQLQATKGRASWHPGYRTHQLFGRTLAFVMLTALQEAMKLWNDTEHYALPADSAWHVTDYYQNIRQQLVTTMNNSFCFTDSNLPTPRLCTTPLKGVSEFTPRFRPEHTSIRSIMVNNSHVPPAPPNLYDGPDIFNPALEPPEGEINVVAILESDDTTGTHSRHLADASSLSGSAVAAFAEQSNHEKAYSHPMETTTRTTSSSHQYHRGLGLPIGRGWSLDNKAGDMHCNGTWDSECGRGASDECLLYGHNDGRGGLIFDSLSGWMVVNLPVVKEGIIIIKFDTWYSAGSALLTKDWKEENNGETRFRYLQGRPSEPPLLRRFDGNVVEEEEWLQNENNYDDNQLYDNPMITKHRILASICDDFVFEYSINGTITSLNKDAFAEKKKQVQRVVETLTLLDEPTFQANDVELGIRIRGCQHETTFHLTHIYWA